MKGKDNMAAVNVSYCRLLSMSVTAEMKSNAGFNWCKVPNNDEHKDTAQARVTRDHSDGLKILSYLQKRDPLKKALSTWLPVKLQMNLLCASGF